MPQKQQRSPKVDQIKIKQPPVLFNKTQNIIREIQDLLGAPFLAYWNSPKGSVCDNDVVAFYELLETIGKQKKIYLFIKSDGGDGEASLRIMNLVRQYCKKVIALVPLECASAATMMAIGSNEIKMGPMAHLSAVDTSLTHELSPIDTRNNRKVGVSLDELDRVIRLWNNQNSDNSINPYNELYQYVHPLVIGAIDRADSLSVMLCEELLSYHMSDRQKIKSIADALNSKYPSHSYPILIREAVRIGLNVSAMDKRANSLLLELNELYSEMGQRATTDFDEIKSHSNEIINILEAGGLQVYFQNDKDWFYRAEERRWITMNDNSNWRKIEKIAGKMKKSIFHIN
ncbi:MAG: ATP-dependent Clp protease proteolytic subunit [Thermodesulfobacteriota bacterium]